MDQQLRKNTLWLTVVQIGNYAVPILVFPHLTRVLGAAGFGQIGFATAFTMYFVLIVEWGFNLSSTHRVAIFRGDKAERSAVFWETIFARFALALMSFAALAILIITVPKLNEFVPMLLLGLLQVLSVAISPIFYFQGIEQLSKPAFISFMVRASSIPLITFLIQDPNQIVLAFGIQSACFLFSSILNCLQLSKANEIYWVKPSSLHIKSAFIKATPYFLSSAGISLYTNSNAVILGFVSNEVEVGYFVAGFALAKAVVGLSGPFSQALFPRVSQLLNKAPAESGNFLRSMLKLQAILGGLLSVALLIFLPWGVTWFYGNSFLKTLPVVAWLSPLPLIVCVASALGMQMLIPLGHGRWFAGVLLLGGLINCSLLVPLGWYFGATGAAVSVLCTECIIMLGMGLGLKKLEPQIWDQLFNKTAQ